MKKDYLARTLTKVGGELENDVIDDGLKKTQEDKVILYVSRNCIGPSTRSRCDFDLILRVSSCRIDTWRRLLLQ